jgi:hypothetical protein
MKLKENFWEELNNGCFPLICRTFTTPLKCFLTITDRQRTEQSNIPWKQTRVLWCRTNSFEPGFSNADGLTRRPSTWSPVSRALQYSFISLPQTLQCGTYCITLPAIRCPFWLQQWVSGHRNTALRLIGQKHQINNIQYTAVFQNVSLSQHTEIHFYTPWHTKTCTDLKMCACMRVCMRICIQKLQ